MIARPRAVVLAFLLAIAATGALVPGARAQDRVYWTEVGGPAAGLSFAALDGSGGGTLAFPIPGTSAFSGLTVDTAGGRFYWTRENQIESIALDGSGQRVFDSGGVRTVGARSLSIDPQGRRLIWTQGVKEALIEVARLDGSGGGPLTSSHAINAAAAAIFDPPSQRVYWTDPSGITGSPLSSAAIDGTGGTIVPVANGKADGRLAIDHAHGRIYWVQEGVIRAANLDGSGEAPLATLGATVAEPQGLAIDELTGTIYWGNGKAHALSYARLDGSGAGQVNIAGAFAGNPVGLVLLVAPRSVATPRVSGAAEPGATLTCSSAWNPDQPQANLFDTPSSLAYRWTRDGVPIAGAEGQALTVPAAGAAYACAVTAANAAGSTTVASAPLAVPLPQGPRPPGFGPATAVTVKLAHGPARHGLVKVSVENFNPFAVSGDLAATSLTKKAPRRAKIAALTFTVGPAATTTATLRLPSPLRKLLEADRKLKLRLTATVTDPLGTRRQVVTTAAATAPGHRA